MEDGGGEDIEGDCNDKVASILPEEMERMSSRMRAMWFVFTVALIVRVAGVMVVPVDRRPDSDEALVIRIAENIAAGKGFQLDQGVYWLNQPTVCRSHGPSIILALPFLVVPDRFHWQTARAINVLFDSAGAALMVLLCLKLGTSRRTAVMAGIVYAVNPVLVAISAALYRDSMGYPLLLLFMISLCGSAELMKSWKRALAAGLALGCACTIRNEWVFLAVLSAFGFLWIGRKTLGQTLPWLVVFTLAVSVPVVPWMIRNYVLFDRFPLLVTGTGEALRGGNNDLTSDRHNKYWGYFVFPDYIHGEVPLAALAARMSEVQIDRYYMQGGWKWIKENPGKLPLLAVGKFSRSYVPIPRTRGIMVVAGSAFRWLVYILAGIGFYLAWKERITLNRHVWWMACSIALTQFLTVIVFCGYFKYVVASELLLCIPAGMVLSRIAGKLIRNSAAVL